VVKPNVVALSPVGASGLEQDGGAANVGIDEIEGTIDGAIDVALRGEVHHGVHGVPAEEVADERRVADVALDKGVSVAERVGDSALAGQVTGVGQRVEIDDPQLGIAGQRDPEEVAPDEAGAAGDQHGSRTVGVRHG